MQDGRKDNDFFSFCITWNNKIKSVTSVAKQEIGFLLSINALKTINVYRTLHSMAYRLSNQQTLLF